MLRTHPSITRGFYKAQPNQGYIGFNGNEGICETRHRSQSVKYLKYRTLLKLPG